MKELLCNADSGEFENFNEYLKSVVLELGLDKVVRKVSKEFFERFYDHRWSKKIEYIHNELDYRLAEEFDIDVRFACQLVKCAVNMNNALYNRRQRVFDRVNEMLLCHGSVYFGTLTFRDDVLANTSELTRRRYVSRFLNSLSHQYVANIDYGDKEKNPESNEREHYHCLINVSDMPPSWDYGFCKFELVPSTEEDVLRTSKYVAKLSHHALKQTKDYKAPRLIYGKWKLPF